MDFEIFESTGNNDCHPISGRFDGIGCVGLYVKSAVK